MNWLHERQSLILQFQYICNMVPLIYTWSTIIYSLHEVIIFDCYKLKIYGKADIRQDSIWVTVTVSIFCKHFWDINQKVLLMRWFNVFGLRNKNIPPPLPFLLTPPESAIFCCFPATRRIRIRIKTRISHYLWNP